MEAEVLFARNYLADAQIDLVANPDLAHEWLETRASVRIAEAQFALSQLLISGLLGEVDRPTSFEWCRRAAACAYAPALILLSAFYSEGWANVQRDDERALSLLRQAADAGYAHAMALLATAYSEGIKVARDGKRGHESLRQTAEDRDANSQLLLARELLESSDSDDQLEEVRWMNRSVLVSPVVLSHIERLQRRKL